MTFEVHLATAAAPFTSPMTLDLESKALPMTKLTFGAPGVVLPPVLIPAAQSLFDLGLLFRCWGASSSVYLEEVGSDDVLHIVALPNVVDGSPNLGAFFTGNLRHVTNRGIGGRKHCTVTCDGRTQECCAECGAGHAKSKICC